MKTIWGEFHTFTGCAYLLPHLTGYNLNFHMKNPEIRFSGLASKNVLGLDAKKAGKKDCLRQFRFHVSQYFQTFLRGKVKTKHDFFKDVLHLS